MQKNAAPAFSGGRLNQQPQNFDENKSFSSANSSINTNFLPVSPVPQSPLVLPLPPVRQSQQPLQDQMLQDPRLVAGIEEAVRQGKILETEGRWTEALAHYETAIRTFHKAPLLMEHFRVVRFHYDVLRRYQDVSFDAMIRQMTFEDSLALYDEVISKIQTSHVDPPYWNEMFAHGLLDFQIALSTPLFQQRNLPQTDILKMRSLGQKIVQTTSGWAIRDSITLRQGIIAVADNCQREIGLNPSAVVLEFLAGITNALDPYTEFMTLNRYNDTNSMINGSFIGLGVEPKMDNISLYINRVIPGSPAERSGLKSLDHILYVDGVPTKGLDVEPASNLLQGEIGTEVTLIVQSENQPPHQIKVRRDQVKVPSVENVRMLSDYTGDTNIGYFKLTSFQQNTVQEIEDALNALQKAGMQYLVVDLRGNPGGMLTEAIGAADLFMRQGVIVRTKNRGLVPEYVYSATPKKIVCDIPLIVLINEDSASASEIFAGAIRDNKRGTVIGRKSYGKDTVQAVHALYGNRSNTPIAGLKLTIETYYSPNGSPATGVGVQPDIVVSNEPYYAGRIPNDGIRQQMTSPLREDRVLRAAVNEVLKQNMTTSMSIHAPSLN
ncbi:MAG: S41 family peptidase [Planctomycetaceae bacterium]|nr:S41 family peptidase [Planctomycetaceae bacterium]